MAGFGGVIGTILGWLGYQVGQRTDAASASGSLHAKVGDLKNFTSSFLNSLQKPRGAPVIGVGEAPDSESYLTLLNITGKGQLLFIYLTDIQPVTTTVRVSIDNVVVSEGCSGTSSSSTKKFPVNFLTVDPSYPMYSKDNVAHVLNIPFKSGLKIEARKKDGTYTSRVYWIYVLE